MALFSFLQTLTQSQTVLISISLIIIIAAILGLISKLLKQELILAYIITGIVLGPLVFGLIKDKALISGFAEIGISFLLFIAGLEMSIKKLKEIVGISIISGIIQVAAVAAASFFLLISFGFYKIEALWLGIAIAFSSTVVVLKLLADKNELDTLHGKLIIGIMLAQDIIAIVVLAILSKEYGLTSISFNLSKLLAFFVFSFLISKPVQIIIKKSSNSGELLFLISLAFLFLFSSIAYFLQFSLAIGAFAAGLILANTPYKLDIEAKVRPLKDFFSILFFVMIGMWLTSISKGILLPMLPLLFILIFVEPLVTALVLRIRGYKAKQALDVGFAFAQLSEFTLIVALTAVSVGVITQRAFDLIVLVAVISIALTPYTMKLSKLFYSSFKIFDKIKLPLLREIGHISHGKKTVLLIGCHRMGSIFIQQLEKIKHKLLVIDFNPEIVRALERKGISVVYGDIADIELLNLLPLQNLKVVISTIPTKEHNLLLVHYFKKAYPNVFIAVVAQRIDDALELYESGADYVILPLITGAEHAIEIIKKLSKKQFKNLKKMQIKHLQELHRILY
ncbi:MAG: cation:proton antiporter [Candidatus Pacearchaeota archaeon]